MYSAYWFTHYYVFSALVALYLYVIQSRSKPAHMWKHYLDLAQQGLRDLASCSTDTTYAQRYVVVLTELQEEAMILVGERRSTLPTNDGQGPPKHSNIRPEHTPIMDVDVPSITTAPSDGDLVSSELHAFVSELEGPQSTRNPGSLNSNDTYIYPGAGEPWDLHGMANQEAFRDLNIEGLADLAFIFSGEPTNLIQSEALAT